MTKQTHKAPYEQVAIMNDDVSDIAELYNQYSAGDHDRLREH
jgi:hypothetical protein